MRGQFLLFISILHMLNLVWITRSRPFVPNGGHASQTGTEQSLMSLQITMSSDKVSTFGVVGVEGNEEETDEYKEVSRVGSIPHQAASTSALDACHVKPFRCQQPAAEWECNMQIMNLRAGNASVVLPSTLHRARTKIDTT